MFYDRDEGILEHGKYRKLHASLMQALDKCDRSVSQTSSST
jgi:hypothetical protein